MIPLGAFLVVLLNIVALLSASDDRMEPSNFNTRVLAEWTPQLENVPAAGTAAARPKKRGKRHRTGKDPSGFDRGASKIGDGFQGLHIPGHTGTMSGKKHFGKRGRVGGGGGGGRGGRTTIGGRAGGVSPGRLAETATARSSNDPIEITFAPLKDASSGSSGGSSSGSAANSPGLFNDPIALDGTDSFARWQQKRTGSSSSTTASHPLSSSSSSSFSSPGKKSPAAAPPVAATSATPAVISNVLATERDFPKVPNGIIATQRIASGPPDTRLQKASFELEDKKLHLCNAVFEAYAASYLTTREHIVDVASETFNLKWVNCEMASFIHMKNSRQFLKDKDGRGMVMQTLDVLDYSAIHLSAFERSSKRYRHQLWSSQRDRRVAWHDIEPVKEAARLLEAKVNPNKTGRPLEYLPEARDTVVVMPFLGGAMGAGHSVLGNRFEYLKACFWSIYEYMPNIVIGVSRQEDVDWGWKESGLPFYDILRLDNLPKSAGLPVGTMQRVKQKFTSGDWKFKYLFFSESDQIVMFRVLPALYANLKKYPHRMLLPHRLMPYSYRVIHEMHGKDASPEALRLTLDGTSLQPASGQQGPTKDMLTQGWMPRPPARANDSWQDLSCCLPRQNCQERKTWRKLAHPSVPVVNVYGLYVPLGNVNFLDEFYRACRLGPRVSNYCP